MARAAAETPVPSARQQVQALRDQVAALKARRREVERLPVLMTEALDAIDSGLDALVANATKHLEDSTSVLRPGGGRPRLDFSPSIENLPSLLALIARDTLADAMRARVIEAYEAEGSEGISATDRRAALAEIDADILATEAAEEMVIRTEEADGSEILRRGDANPAIVLAFDDELKGLMR